LDTPQYYLHMNNDPQSIEHEDRRLCTQTNTATTYQEIRILAKFYIFTCFIRNVTIVECTYNIVTMYCRVRMSVACKLKLLAKCCLYKYHVYNLSHFSYF